LLKNFKHKDMEFITTIEKTDKRGNKYYVQDYKKMNMDHDGNITEEIIWSGRVKKEDFEWCEMIAKDQPKRLVLKEDRILIITN
jgi:hypothetical protein